MVYPWGDTRRYNSCAGHFRRLFGGRVQKLRSMRASPAPTATEPLAGRLHLLRQQRLHPLVLRAASKSITQQIDEGIEFHRNRYRSAQRYLVYFQSFSNTYAPVERLRALYGEALAHPGVAGLVIGTRPDCVDDERLDLLCELARDRYIAVEYGIESTSDATLLAVNRGHDSPAPGRPLSGPPRGPSLSARTSSSACRARATQCSSRRRPGSTPCRSRV